MKKNAIKILTLLLAVLFCVILCASCKKKDDSDGTEDTDAVVNALELVSDATAKVSIVYNNDNTVITEAVNSLKSSLRELGGVEIPLKTASEGDGVEILIGNTGSDAAKAAMDELSPNSYSITVSGNKIIVVSNNIYLYSEAVEALVSSLGVADGTVTLAGDFAKKSDSYPVVALSSETYTIIYPEGNGAASSQAAVLKAALSNAGINVEVSSDKKSASGREILFGNTNRAFSSNVTEYYRSVNFLVRENGDLAIKGELSLAVEAITDVVRKLSDAKNEIAIPQAALTRRTTANYGTAPKYHGEGTEKITDGFESFKSYVVQYDGASEADFESYIELLKGEGYKLHYTTSSQESRFATYTDGHSVVNASYIQYQSPSKSGETVKYVNIAIDAKENTVVPVLEDDSRYCSELQVSLLNSHNTWLIRLEDGRFIMVDGGLEEKDGRKNADVIYNALVAQNELPGKPVIAAWLFTHAHSDHVEGFYSFTQKYKGKVELEMVIVNTPAKAVDSTLANYSSQIYSGVSASFPNAKIVTAHAGQRFAFAGLDLDVLWTHENLYDVSASGGNVTSTVYSMTMPGGRLIITGDQTPDGCKIVNAIYREELKCDVVQFCHHGFYGGAKEMYESMDARVGVWPIDYEWAKSVGAYGNISTNHIDVSAYEFHLIMSQSDEIMTLREGMTKDDLKHFRNWE